MKLKTGIEKLDEILDGGMDSGSVVLIISDTLVDKASFAQHILSQRILDGDKGIYITTTKIPKQILKNMYEHGFEFSNIEFIDCISFTYERESEAKYIVKEKIINVENSWNELNNIFIKTMNEIQGFKTIVFDSLETFMSIGADKIIEKIKEWKNLVESSNSLMIILLTNWGYSKEEIELIKNNVDKVIQVGTIEKKLTWINYFSVENKPKIFFTITATGVNLYIPKILVTGPYHAGKSSTVKSLSERAVSVNRLGTTIALDHGYIERKGIVCDIFGTPGQERFDWILKILAKDVWGIILIVDSTKPETFGRALEMLEKAREENIPFVIFANKQDLSNALSPKEIAKMFNVNEEDVIPTSAIKNEGLEEGLKRLINKIFKNYSYYG